MFEYETYDRAAMKESSEEYQQAAKDQWMVDEAAAMADAADDLRRASKLIGAAVDVWRKQDDADVYDPECAARLERNALDAAKLAARLDQIRTHAENEPDMRYAFVGFTASEGFGERLWNVIRGASSALDTFIDFGISAVYSREDGEPRELLWDAKEKNPLEHMFHRVLGMRYLFAQCWGVVDPPADTLEQEMRRVALERTALLDAYTIMFDAHSVENTLTERERKDCLSALTVAICTLEMRASMYARIAALPNWKKALFLYESSTEANDARTAIIRAMYLCPIALQSLLQADTAPEFPTPDVLAVWGRAKSAEN